MKKAAMVVAGVLATTSTNAWAEDSAVEAFEKEFAQVQMEVQGAGAVDLSDHPDAPSKGTGFLIGGIVAGGLGVVGVGYGAMFYAFADHGEDVTVPVVAMVAGGVLVAGGIGLVVISLVQRSAHSDWIEQKKREQGFADHLVVQPLPGGGGLGWQGTF